MIKIDCVCFFDGRVRMCRFCWVMFLGVLDDVMMRRIFGLNLLWFIFFLKMLNSLFLLLNRLLIILVVVVVWIKLI